MNTNTACSVEGIPRNAARELRFVGRRPRGSVSGSRVGQMRSPERSWILVGYSSVSRAASSAGVSDVISRYV